MFQLLYIDLQPTWLQQPFQISSCALISASWWSCDCWSSEHDMKLLQLQLSWQYCYIYTRTQHCINPSLIPYWLNHDTSCDHVNHFDRSSCTFQIKPILVFLHVISIYSVYTVLIRNQKNNKSANIRSRNECSNKNPLNLNLESFIALKACIIQGQQLYTMCKRPRILSNYYHLVHAILCCYVSNHNVQNVHSLGFTS